MSQKHSISIGGELSIKVYDSGGHLKYTKSGIKNFITSTGLCYPAFFPFADCFRFLSLGLSNTANNITDTCSELGGAQWGTTGLYSKSLDVDGEALFQYIGSRNYSTPSDINTEIVSQYLDGSCGFTEVDVLGGSSYLKLTRGWRIPVQGAFTSAYDFKEFMVSPGTPPMKGFFDWELTIPTEVCSCTESVFIDNPDNPGVGDIVYRYGNDCAAISLVDFDTYSNIKQATNATQRICAAHKAFARIITDMSVGIGDYSEVTYSLKLNFTTGQGVTAKFINLIGGGNWGSDAYYTGALIHPGIRLINDGSASDNNYDLGAGNERKTQWAGYDFKTEYGESFVPGWGNPLDPSVDDDYLVFYTSTDNMQFMANGKDGGKIADGDVAKQLNLPGIMQWQRQATSNLKTEGIPDKWKNIRRDGTLPFYPQPSDISTEGEIDTLLEVAEAGTKVEYGSSSKISHVAILEDLTDNTYKAVRTHTSQYSSEIVGSTAGFSNMVDKPVRAMVWGFADVSSAVIVPFFDLLFRNTDSDSPVIPPINRISALTTYTLPSNDAVAAKYNYIHNGGVLTTNFILSWTSAGP